MSINLERSSSAPMTSAPRRSIPDFATSRERDLDLLASPVPAAPRVGKTLSGFLTPPRNVRRVLDKTARTVEAVAPYVLTAGMVACLLGKARAYPCTGYDSDANQYFINPNQTIFGQVHAWFSDCYDYVCGEVCSTSCSSSSSGSQSCSQSCTPTYCTATDETPQYYANTLSALVEQTCGFNLVGSIPAANLTRIANALIEANHWATIRINTFNITNTTDPAVDCLHNLG